MSIKILAKSNDLVIVLEKKKMKEAKLGKLAKKWKNNFKNQKFRISPEMKHGLKHTYPSKMT